LQGKELQREAKAISPELQRMAVERMRTREDAGELAKELGVTRRCLYKWRAKLDLAEAASLIRPCTGESPRTSLNGGM
jgi:hypothetical protein